MMENRMVLNTGWTRKRAEIAAPVCYYCEQLIRQEKALPILLGKRRVWLCDECIEDNKEWTGFEED